MAQTDLHESKVSQVLGIAITFPALALITVILRLYTRFLVIKNPSYEDIFIVIAMILSIGLTVTYIYGIRHGLGRHIATVDPALLPGHFHSLFATIIVYNLGLTFTKLSILLQYVRIIVKPRMRKAIWAFIICIIAFGIATFFAIIYQCAPIAFFWNQRIPGGKCSDSFAGAFFNAGFNITTDFLILLFPILIMKDTLMPKMQKYIVIGILSLGGAACIASILRLYFLYQYYSTISKDPTWNGSSTAIWSDIEINVGIICGSICTLRPLLSHFFPKIFGTQNRSGRDTDPQSNNYSNYSASVNLGQFNSLHSTLHTVAVRGRIQNF